MDKLFSKFDIHNSTVSMHLLKSRFSQQSGGLGQGRNSILKNSMHNHHLISESIRSSRNQKYGQLTGNTTNYGDGTNPNNNFKQTLIPTRTTGKKQSSKDAWGTSPERSSLPKSSPYSARRMNNASRVCSKCSPNPEVKNITKYGASPDVNKHYLKRIKRTFNNLSSKAREKFRKTIGKIFIPLIFY